MTWVATRKTKRNIRRAGLLLALILVCIAQFYFIKDNRWTGVKFFASGFIVAILSAQGKVPKRLRDWASRFGENEEKDDTVVPAPESPRKFPRWLEISLVLLIFAIAFGLRAYKISEIPPSIFDDESNTAYDAIRVIEGEYPNPFATGWYQVPILYSYFNSIAFRIFGINVFAARVTGLFFAFMTVVAMYFFTRYVLGVRMALVATALFALSRYHITMSRWGATEIAPSFFMLMSFGFMMRGLEIREGMTPRITGSRPRAGFLRWPGWLFVLSGLFLGLGIYTYLASRLVALVVCLYMIYFMFFRFDIFRRNFWRLLLLGIVFLLVFAPLAYHYYSNPGTLNSRLNEISIFRFCREARSLQPLWDNLGRYVLMFNWKANQIARHCLPGKPLLNPVTGVLFVLGAAFSLRRIRHPFYFFLHLWFWVTMLGGILSFRRESPCSYPILTCSPAIYMFVVVACLEFWDSFIPLGSRIKLLAWSRRAFWGLMTALVIYSGAINTYVYFGIQAKDPRMWAHYNPVEFVAALRIRDYVEEGFKVYINPHYYTFSTVKLLNHPYRDIHKFLGSESVPFMLPEDKPIALILSYGDDWILPMLEQFYSNVEMERYTDPVTPDIGFLVFIIPEEDIANSRGLKATYSVDSETGSGPTATRRERQINLVLDSEDLPVLESLERKSFGASWEGVINLEPTQEDPIVEGYRLGMPIQFQFGLKVSGAQNGDNVETEVEIGWKTFCSNGQLQAHELSPGHYPVKVKADGLREGMKVQLWWRPVGEAEAKVVPARRLFTLEGLYDKGLRGIYYRTLLQWDGKPVMEKVDKILSVTEKLGSPYCVKWVGEIHAEQSGDYVFGTKSDDDSFVFINGRQIVDNGGAHGSHYAQGSVKFTEGWHDIEVRFCNRGGGQSFELFWSPPGEGRSTVPPEVLRPK